MKVARHEPELHSIRRHLELVAASSSVSEELKVEIAFGDPNEGPNRARCFGTGELDNAALFAADVNARSSNVYLGTTLKTRDAPMVRRTSNRHAGLATCMAIDIDDDLVRAARKLPYSIRPRLLTVTGRSPGLRGHLWIALVPTANLELWDEVLSGAVQSCGGDLAARGRSRVMRLAGTVSFPSDAKRKRGYEEELTTAHFVAAPAYNLSDLAQLFVEPGRRTVSTREAGLAPSWASEGEVSLSSVEAALRALPDHYAERYDLWIRTGFAVHDFDSSERGLMMWKDFSSRCPEKAASTDFVSRWRSMSRGSPRHPITKKWLFAEACRHGWRANSDRVCRRGKW